MMILFQQKLDYIHLNAVKTGLCNLPEEYIYSSANYYEAGLSYRDEILTHYRG
jgi:putative transposase